MRAGAIVAAAGLSRRMGAEKVLLPLGRSTILETVLTSLAAAGVDDVVVVVRPDLQAARVAAERAGARVVENPNPRAELLSSIRLGLSALASSLDAFFVWPADHPLISPGTLRILLDAGSTETAVIPTFDGRRGHPALVGSGFRPAVLDGSLEGGLRQLWRQREDAVRELEVPDRGVLLDINTPDDYRDALELVARNCSSDSPPRGGL